MIIYGTRATGITQFAVPNVACGHCQSQNAQRIAVFGRYAHVFWIPLFPIGKVAVAECSHCKRTLEKSEFTPALRHRYDDEAKEVKRPVWHWTGLTLILLLVGFGSISAALEQQDPRYPAYTADVRRMTAAPSLATDSVAYDLKRYLDATVREELEPHTFTYTTHEADDRVLFLVAVPRLAKVEKSVRPEIVDLIDDVARSFPHLAGKARYIAVRDKSSLMLLATPDGEVHSGWSASPEKLFPFYGPAE